MPYFSFLVNFGFLIPSSAQLDSSSIFSISSSTFSSSHFNKCYPLLPILGLSQVLEIYNLVPKLLQLFFFCTLQLTFTSFLIYNPISKLLHNNQYLTKIKWKFN